MSRSEKAKKRYEIAGVRIGEDQPFRTKQRAWKDSSLGAGDQT